MTNLEKPYYEELEYIKNSFCGIVLYDTESFNDDISSRDTIVYLCGTIEQNYEKIKLVKNKMICVIKELSDMGDFCPKSDNNLANYKLIGIGEVPININNVGVYFRNIFSSNKDYFNLINNVHQFQTLTESNKPDNAFRKGIYLTKVEEIDHQIKFKLLRCSTNFNGPTDNLRAIDNEILNQVNTLAESFFEEKIELNHVLAQIYENTSSGGQNKNSHRKAKIKEHSDKTKDMPRNGLIAFCSFYTDYSENKFNDVRYKKSKDDFYDHCFNDVSVLTKLRFRLKNNLPLDPKLKKDFHITLYPNSVFILSLCMNRLYTHEIVPSILPIDKIPIRMGYVIRCSQTNAVFKNNQTYIDEKSVDTQLAEPDEDGVAKLKKLYFKENSTNEIIDYDKFYFSLNQGDYKKPIL